MKIVFLEVDTLGRDVDLSEFEQLGTVVKYPDTKMEEVGERLEDADIVVVNKLPMKETTLQKAEKLKLICITGTGTNIVDFSYTNGRGIGVANVKGYSTQSVIQHTFALFFYLYEKLAYYDHFVKSRGYINSDIFSHFEMKFNELAGKTWGIIGLGEIGRGVARVAEMFGCRILYYSTTGKNQNPDYEQRNLEELLQESDIVSIHAPLNEKTRGLVGEKELRRMKSTAILLNLGRGPIIDEYALTEALLENRIAGAGLDVISREPMSPDNPLIKVQDSTKLIITPHIAWATVEARRRCAKEVCENIAAFQRGEKRNIVTE